MIENLSKKKMRRYKREQNENFRNKNTTNKMIRRKASIDGIKVEWRRQRKESMSLKIEY